MGVCVTLSRMDELQESVRAWLTDVLRQTGKTPSALARAIGTSTSTLTRYLNQPDHKHVLSTRTIDAITRVTGLPGPPGAGSSGARLPAGEIDGMEINTQTGDVRVDDAVRYLCAAENGLSPWRLNTRALEGVGYLPGDVVVVDLNADAESGDVVVAQVYDQRGAETVFRLYAKPFLTAAANDRVARVPLLVDDAHVCIRGVVVAMFRPRRGHLAVA